MNNLSKSAAVTLLKQHGLETLPAKQYKAESLPSAAKLAIDFDATMPLVLRTSGLHQVLNLPRIAGLSSDQAAEWIRNVVAPQHLDLLVQPYDEVIYSIELLVTPSIYLAELIPGIWELDSTCPVTTLRVDRALGSFSISSPLGEVSAKFHSADRGYALVKSSVVDWHITTLLEWIDNNDQNLHSLRTHLRVEAFGLKLHYAAAFGISPQNLRLDLPSFDLSMSATQDSVVAPVINKLADAVALRDSAVIVDISIAREAHDQVRKLGEALVQQNISVAYVRSGLLSHLAITLRECGLTVRRLA